MDNATQVVYNAANTVERLPYTSPETIILPTQIIQTGTVNTLFESCCGYASS